MDDTSRRLEDRLVAEILGTSREEYPERAVDAARVTLLDSLAVGLGAFDHPAVAAARRYVRRHEPPGHAAPIWGTDDASTVHGALLANTVPLRCYDFNDVLHGSSGQAGHPSDFVPGLVAVAQAQSRSGAELLGAIIRAYDATRLLFDVVNIAEEGWDYATLVGLGAVAGFRSLMGLSAAEGAQALGMFAASRIGTDQLESGDLTPSGNLTMWKRFNGAEAAAGALRVCQLASCGVEAPAYGLLGDRGLIPQLGGDRGRVAEALDQEREVHGVELTEFKRWPVGTRAQSAISAALDCRARLSAPRAVEAATVEVEPAVVDHLVRDEAWSPRSRETADHSLPFIVALALIEGDVTIDHFATEQWFGDERVARLIANIEVTRAPNASPGRRSSFPARVVAHAGADSAEGHGQYPPDQVRAAAFRNEVSEKFRRVASRALPAEQVRELHDTVLEVDSADDLMALTELLRLPRGKNPPPGPQTDGGAPGASLAGSH